MAKALWPGPPNSVTFRMYGLPASGKQHRRGGALSFLREHLTAHVSVRPTLPGDLRLRGHSVHHNAFQECMKRSRLPPHSYWQVVGEGGLHGPRFSAPLVDVIHIP